MRWWRVWAIACAVLLAIVPLPRSAVERWYSSGVYPQLQSIVTAASNLVPFALFDLFAAVVVAWAFWRIVSAFIRRSAARQLSWPARLASTLLQLATAASLLYVAFLACWGLNYRRVALEDKLAYEEGRISSRRARDLALNAVSRANVLYAAAHAHDARPFDIDALARAFGEAERELGVPYAARPARPKHTLLDPYFKLAGVDGMTDPYFLETLTVSDLLPFEKPFVVAHEWGHLAGFADESAANFAGWLACVHGGEAEQYSGWMFLYSEIVGRLSRADAVQVSAHLDEGPRRDLRAVAERINKHVNRQVSTVGWRMYDSYLRANRVQAGTASYEQVVKLVLGTEFDEEWRPRLR